MDADSPETVVPFPPPTEIDTTPPPHEALPPARPRTPARRLRSVYVVPPPPLASAERRQYRDMPSSREMSLPVDEIVGEWTEKGEDLFFARYDGGILSKYPKDSFTAQHPKLVQDFEARKAAGDVEPFDPTARDDIHPMSRGPLKLKLGKARTVTAAQANRARYGTSNDDDIVMDSEPERDDSDDGNADEDFQEGTPRPVRRSTRAHAKQTTLPFSPKKTRRQKVYTVDSDAEEESDAPSHAPARRSTRARKAVKVDLAEYSEEEEEEESDEDDEDEDDDGGNYRSRKTRRGKKAPTKSKRKPRAAGSRPAYGHFRPIADMDYDTDEETAPLRAHRDICEKCHREPTHIQVTAALKKKGKGRRRKKTSDDEIEEDSADELARMKQGGGWVRCLKCPVTAHWKCLASTQRDEILKAARSQDRVNWLLKNPGGDVDKDGPKKRPGLEIDQTTEFICGSCIKGGICMSCEQVALQPEVARKDVKEASADPTKNEEGGQNGPSTSTAPPTKESTSELLFRCFTCKRLSHYHDMQPKSDDDETTVEVAASYQKNWLCKDCVSFTYPLDKILAWRPYPATAVEENPLYANYQNQLPREYLVKWEKRSYRRTTWVPHMWLLSTHPAKLKNFISGGTKVDLLSSSKRGTPAVEEPASIFENDASRDSSVKPSAQSTPPLPQDAIIDAESRLPPQWQTIDRILDLRLWYVAPPKPKKKPTKAKSRKGKGKQRVVDSDAEEESEEDAMDVDVEEVASFGPEYDAAFYDGEPPPDDVLETIEDWEQRTGQVFTLENKKLVVWAFIKWEDLSYEESSWDSPPMPDDDSKYEAFERALTRFLKARKLTVPKRSPSELKVFENRAQNQYKRLHTLKDAADLQLGQKPELKLMPFQVDGFNWLCDNWWNKQPCILADEMGLGKTVQIATFIGKVAQEWQAFPALVVVPNSTITNWVREFERWAPNLRVVPFYGEAKSRDVIKNFELKHNTKTAGTTGAKFHVLVTTYESLLNPKDFSSVFKAQPRWEVLVIDEGQRLKSDSSLLFRKLNELNSIHRIIMTGTPLNNNIRELFNLMNFLDPDEWSDLVSLEQEYEELTEDLIKQLHERLRPYFLRRIKSQVLTLPPKNEVIVPVSMAPLQKEVYRSILSHNSELLQGLTTGNPGTQGKSRINNVLMQLRKCLQHPYLYSEDIERRGLPEKETHERLIDASAKLRFLKMLLPKLKARGHRVLLFSQFVIALNIIEDFLVGEGLKCLRLDGNTKGADRQKGMDEFNRPGSDVFIYLLTTRAGGVGINLFTADTVIIFDPDFNPHQDLQAIARAYRFGQKKTCLVFKLMVKESAEERIVQVGKKKMVLDHLIVQKMDEDDSAGENVQSILTFGAKALFDAQEGNSHDIIYTDADVDNLIEKTEQEGEEETADKEGGMFSFAKIWTADRDALEDVQDEDQGDSWATTLQMINAERDKVREEQEATFGRGTRRRAAAVSYAVDDTPAEKKNSRRTSKASDDGSAFGDSDINPKDLEDSDEESGGANVNPAELNTDTPTKQRQKKAKGAPLNQIQNTKVENCGLCGTKHGDGEEQCVMTENSEHLAEYRQMLLLHADDEPIEDRRAAITAIDEVLHQRKQIYLIAGQPLHLVEKKTVVPYVSKKKAKAPIRSVPAQPIPKPSQPSKPQEASGSTAKRPPPPGPPPSSSPVASTSKRSSPPAPIAAEPPKKKPKVDLPVSCPVCTATYHPLDDCPIVAQGPKRVAKEIRRLETLDGMSLTVGRLRGILTKQKKKALAEANANPAAKDVMVIDSD